MASGGLHSLATIIKRLEAATSRLEDIALHNPGANQPQQGDSAEGERSDELPRSIRAYDEAFITASVKPWVELSHQLGGPIDEQAQLVQAQFNTLRQIIFVASQCQKPDQAGFIELLQPLQKNMEAVSALKDQNRTSRDWFNHLATVAEGASCVGWVTLDSKPAPYVEESKNSAQFYSNRLIKEFKDRNQKHVDWARGYVKILDDMKKYITEYHATGLVWNAKGGKVKEFLSKANVNSAAAGSPPPPPPPPPPAVPAPASASPAAPSPAAVFAELNKGEDVTKGLRKVDKSEMTHKNPSLRTSVPTPSSPSSASTGKKPLVPKKPSRLAAKKPPKFAKDGNKWNIDNQENENSLVVEDTEINQVVTIYNCKNTTVQIKGKVNAVNMLSCTKTSVLVSSVISSISVTNCPSFAVQITGTCPTIQIDKTDSGQVYLSKECLGVEIFTAKCSAINVSLPDPDAGGEDGVFVERAVPEMLRTVVKDGRLATNIVEHSG